ncbi:unnamed protein product [Euphydryas editha]|uniref:Chitin-binding type-2 domain-containing protein n=1 Tax=Euphydryas editha TaxID=104508 RepID=A0AAU9TZ58_EUPED|nr:unnamed protein product [Euphydryas editha]
MDFRKKMDYTFFAILLTVTVLVLPLVSSESIDCKGKAFHCFNSTHFKICVDFGGGVSQTVDDFLIPCPTNTECRDINKYECEQQVTTTLALKQQSDATTEQVELILTSSSEEVDVTTLLPEFKKDEKYELRSDRLRTTELSSSIILEDTTNFNQLTTLDGRSNKITLSRENTIQYNKQSDLSESVTVPYASESSLNLVTNSDEFSTITAKVKKVNDTLLNSLYNSTTNSRDDLSLGKPIKKVEGSATDKNLGLIELIYSPNVNINNKNLYSDTTNLVSISTLITEEESLSTQSEISENDSLYFTESTYVTNVPNILTVPVVVSSNFSTENIANHSSINVLNPVTSTESYNTDTEQATNSNDNAIINSTYAYKLSLNSDVLPFDSSKNNVTKDGMNSFKENVSTVENVYIYDTTKNIFSESSFNLTYTDLHSKNTEKISEKTESLHLQTPSSTMSVKETFENANVENNVKYGTRLISTTSHYKSDNLITLITNNVTSVTEPIYLYTENITAGLDKQHLDNLTESISTIPYVDLLSNTILNSTVIQNKLLTTELLETPSDIFLDNLDLNSSKIEIPINLNESNKTNHIKAISIDKAALVSVSDTYTESNIYKVKDNNDVAQNKKTVLIESMHIVTTSLNETKNSSESNLASLLETKLNLTPQTDVTPLNIDVDLNSSTTSLYTSFPKHSTKYVISEIYQSQKNAYYVATSPTISVDTTNTENNIYKATGDTEVAEHKTMSLNENKDIVTASLIKLYNTTNTSESNLALLLETKSNLTPPTDVTTLNIGVDLNSRATSPFYEQSTRNVISEVYQNQTSTYSVASSPTISAGDANTENNIYKVANDDDVVQNKITLLSENTDTVTTSLMEINNITNSSDSNLATLIETTINLTPLIDVTPSNIGVNLNSRTTRQYTSFSKQSTTDVISEVYQSQTNVYSVATNPITSDFKEKEMLSTTVVSSTYYNYHNVTHKNIIVDDIPYTDNIKNSEESAILVNNSNKMYDNLNINFSLISSTERSSINPFTMQALNNLNNLTNINEKLYATNDNYTLYTNTQKIQSPLDNVIEKVIHTTPFNVEYNVLNVPLSIINTTVNSSLANINQNTVIKPILKQEFTIKSFNENVGKIKTNKIITPTEATNSNLFLTGHVESTKIYSATQNNSRTTNPLLYHKENVTKVVSSKTKNNLTRIDKKDGTILNTVTYLPAIFFNKLVNVSKVQDPNTSSSEAVFKSDVIFQSTSFPMKVAENIQIKALNLSSNSQNVAQTTFRTTISDKYNDNMLNINNNYLNNHEAISTTINLIDDIMFNNSSNVQKIIERTSNDTSTPDAVNIKSSVVSGTASQPKESLTIEVYPASVLSKIFKLSTNDSILKYESTSLLNHHYVTNSNENLTTSLETNINQNVSFMNENYFLYKGLLQNKNYYDNDTVKQPLATSKQRSSSNESKRNISYLKSQSTPLASQFSCLNRDRGKYSDRNNCTKFYICIGKAQPVTGMCPADTVFSEINKQCTRNISHCIRNSQFRCLSSGRFIDVLSENFYYICVKNLGGYIRFKLKCQKGYHLNKENIKCSSDSSSIENLSKTTSDASTNEKISKEFKQSEKYKKQFYCIKEGEFEHPDDCRKYFVCIKGSKSQFRRKIKKCDSDEVFNKDKRKCVDSDTYEC